MTNKALENRIRIEKRIMRRIVTDALNAGFALNVYNGGEEEELDLPTTDRKTILKVMMQADDDRLYFYKNGNRIGWAWLV